MVDDESYLTNHNTSNMIIDVIIPEDNVERLRNIRDMFENSDNSDEQIKLQKVEKLQPSEKIKDRFTNNIMDDLINDFGENNHKQNYSANYDCNHENSNNSINDEHLCSSTTTTNSSSSTNNSSRSQSPLANDDQKPVEHSSPVSSFQTNNVGNELHAHRFEEGIVENETGESVEKKTEREKIAVSVDLNSVKTKFEKGEDTNGDGEHAPKPVRSITPPRDGKIETENQPIERSADVVSVFDKKEEIIPESGIARSRKEMFQQIATTTPGKDAPVRVKSITPPREDGRKLKEKTPEKNENVTRESDRNDEALPSAGTAKATAAIFTTSRTKSIERSGITIEGELAEKGIAKSRLALFNNISTTPSSKDTSVNEDDVKVAKESGVAKERLSLFKNLEQQQQRTSPPKDTAAGNRKLKEFTPPPQLEPHQLQQRQYIIIDKETPSANDAAKDYKNEEYVPESGLAKNRMKQYLETATSATATTNGKHEATNGTAEKVDVMPEKGTAKSLLAKWKSIENIKETNGDTSATALQVATEIKQQRKERQPTPPAENTGATVKETEFLPQSGTAKNLLSKWQNIDKDGEPTNGETRKGPRQITPPLDENVIEKGFAKNVMASYESQPSESNINAQYNTEEIIPSAGLAKSLKSKFQTLEKEAAKIETSSAKLNYTPKKFTKANGTNGNSTTTTTHIQHQVSNGASTGLTEKCVVCSKTVYAMEKIEADKKVYHKLCFKCTICNCTLKLGNFSSIKDKLYCTPHFLQLFARNGNYDEGFGLENYKRKWINRTDHQATTTASS